MNKPQAAVIIVMGVSGSGKSTIGSLLARDLGWDFYDADDFHPPANREKMSHGIPLTDEDRAEWLKILQDLLRKNLNEGLSCVLACSALKQQYRDLLAENDQVQFVHLHGTFEQIEARLSQRTGHYMPVQLLKSQFEALEEPTHSFVVDISHTPEEIIQIIRKGIRS